MTTNKIDFSAIREANIARQAEWPGGEKVDLAFRGLELAGEAGEFCNAVKKLVRADRGIKGNKVSYFDLIENAAEEAADMVISLDLICMELGIDLAFAIRSKFNATSEKNDLTTRL